jgi:hypothetical protein
MMNPTISILDLICDPQAPSGVKDLHSNWHSPSNWNLPFLPSEISNLRFEISGAFAPVTVFAYGSTSIATSSTASKIAKVCQGAALAVPKETPKMSRLQPRRKMFATIGAINNAAQ